MTGDRDEELLVRLGTALAPPPVVPEPLQLEALRLLVADQAPEVVVGPPPRRSTRRVPIALLGAAAAVVIAVAGLATSRPVLPRPVRVIASAAGLPVESPALSDTRQALDQLQDALTHRQGSQIVPDAAALQRRMAALSPGDRRDVGPNAAAALAAAAQVAATPHFSQTAPATAHAPTRSPSSLPQSSAPTVRSEPSGGSSSPEGGTGTPSSADAGRGVGVAGPNPGPTTTTTVQSGDGGHDDGGGGFSPSGAPSSGGPSTRSSDGGGH